MSDQWETNSDMYVYPAQSPSLVDLDLDVSLETIDYNPTPPVTDEEMECDATSDETSDDNVQDTSASDVNSSNSDVIVITSSDEDSIITISSESSDDEMEMIILHDPDIMIIQRPLNWAEARQELINEAIQNGEIRHDFDF